MKFYENLWKSMNAMKINKNHANSLEVNGDQLSRVEFTVYWYSLGVLLVSFRSKPKVLQPANPPASQPANPPTRQPASQPTTWGLCSLQGKPTFFIDLVGNPGVTFQNGPFRTSCFATSIMKYCFFGRDPGAPALAANGFGPPPELL